MDFNARVDVNCGRKDGLTDERTENRTPISHLAKAGSTKMSIIENADLGMTILLVLFNKQIKNAC